jgi:hypothetical protein
MEGIGEVGDIMGFMASDCDNPTNALGNARLFYNDKILDVTRSSDVTDKGVS